MNVFLNDTGYFVISTTSERGSIEAILRTVEEHLERARRGEVNPERVAEAQAALKGRWALAMEDNVKRAMWLAEWASGRGTPQSRGLLGWEVGRSVSW